MVIEFKRTPASDWETANISAAPTMEKGIILESIKKVLGHYPADFRDPEDEFKNLQNKVGDTVIPKGKYNANVTGSDTLETLRNMGKSLSNMKPKITGGPFTMETIRIADFEFAKTIEEVIEYLASTYKDKYTKSPFKTKAMLYGEHGAPINIFQVQKYCGRYLTEGFEKSHNIKDLYKSIHYLLFELARRKKNEKNSE